MSPSITEHMTYTQAFLNSLLSNTKIHDDYDEINYLSGCCSSLNSRFGCIRILIERVEKRSCRRNKSRVNRNHRGRAIRESSRSSSKCQLSGHPVRLFSSVSLNRTELHSFVCRDCKKRKILTDPGPNACTFNMKSAKPTFSPKRTIFGSAGSIQAPTITVESSLGWMLTGLPWYPQDEVSWLFRRIIFLSRGKTMIVRDEFSCYIYIKSASPPQQPFCILASSLLIVRFLRHGMIFFVEKGICWFRNTHRISIYGFCTGDNTGSVETNKRNT